MLFLINILILLGTTHPLYSMKNKVNSKHITPYTAACNGHFYHLKKFIFEDKDLIHKKNEDGYHLISLASMGSHPNCVLLLIANDADVNMVEDKGTSALMSASFKYSTLCIFWLLHAGANIHYKDPYNLTVFDSLIDIGYTPPDYDPDAPKQIKALLKKKYNSKPFQQLRTKVIKEYTQPKKTLSKKIPNVLHRLRNREICGRF